MNIRRARSVEAGSNDPPAGGSRLLTIVIVTIAALGVATTVAHAAGLGGLNVQKIKEPIIATTPTLEIKDNLSSSLFNGKNNCRINGTGGPTGCPTGGSIATWVLNGGSGTFGTSAGAPTFGAASNNWITGNASAIPYQITCDNNTLCAPNAASQFAGVPWLNRTSFVQSEFVTVANSTQAAGGVALLYSPSGKTSVAWRLRGAGSFSWFFGIGTTDGSGAFSLGSGVTEQQILTSPTVTGISPTSGTNNGGTPVTITGTGFAAGATVTIGGGVCTNVNVTSITSLTCVTGGINSTGARTVTVTSPNGNSGTSGTIYTYNASASPTVTGISPNTGTNNGGTSITVTGTNFSTGTAPTVTIGGGGAAGRPACTQVNVTSSTTLTCVTGGGNESGLSQVRVTNPSGIFGQAGLFTYTSTDPNPTVSGISPTSGPNNGGTSVTVSGTNFFVGATKPTVLIGGISCTSVSVTSSTSLTCVTGGGNKTGLSDVLVTNPNTADDQANNIFTYTNPGIVPNPTAISPVSGPNDGGTSVTISGSGFHVGSTKPTVTIGIGGSNPTCTSVNVIDSGTLTCITGGGTVTGASTVKVTNPNTANGQASLFTYTAVPAGVPVKFMYNAATREVRGKFGAYDTLSFTLSGGSAVLSAGDNQNLALVNLGTQAGIGTVAWAGSGLLSASYCTAGTSPCNF